MIQCVFLGTSPDNQCCECRLCGLDLEVCLESLAVLVREGWQLQQITLLDPPRAPLHLPVEAIDGQSMLIPISQLRMQWEAWL